MTRSLSALPLSSRQDPIGRERLLITPLLPPFRDVSSQSPVAVSFSSSSASSSLRSSDLSSASSSRSHCSSVKPLVVTGKMRTAGSVTDKFSMMRTWTPTPINRRGSGNISTSTFTDHGPGRNSEGEKHLNSRCILVKLDTHIWGGEAHKKRQCHQLMERKNDDHRMYSKVENRFTHQCGVPHSPFSST